MIFRNYQCMSHVPSIVYDKKSEIIRPTQLDQIVSLSLGPAFVRQMSRVLGIRVFNESYLFIVLGERILFGGVVVNAAPVREKSGVGARRILELTPVPFARTVSQLGFRMLVDLGLFHGYERRALVTVVFVNKAPDFTVNALRTLGRFDQSLDFLLF